MRIPRIDKLLTKFPFVTKSWLEEVYVKQEKSLPEMLSEYGLDFRATTDLMRHFGVPRRTISQSRLTKTAKEKIVHGIRKKYGVDNPSQCDFVKEKKRKTFLEHYGVDNIWKSNGYGEWLSDYMLIRYGKKRISTNPWGWIGIDEESRANRMKILWSGRDKWWETLNDEEKSEMARRLCKNNKSSSKLESRVAEALSRLRIVAEPHTCIGGKNFDFRLDRSKILLEINGDFWHANPKKYDAEDVVNLPGKKMKASELWKRDQKKIQSAERRGYKVVTLWEDELNKMSDEALDEWILKQYGE